MAFKKCLRCGKLSRKVDPLCWNCKGVSFEAEKVSGRKGETEGDEKSKPGMVTHRGPDSMPRPFEPPKVLQPCPYCGCNRISYGFSLWEEIKRPFDLKKTAVAVAGGPTAIVVTAWAPLLLGFLKSIKNEVLDDIPTTPLLRCCHCFRFLVVCPSCEQMLGLGEDQPALGSLLECQQCKARFAHCEKLDSFDSLVARRESA